jgi:hypothetical protein
MSPIPVMLRDRWLNRVEPVPGQGKICWHMLMHTHAEARTAAKEAQAIFAEVPGMHLRPLSGYM